MRWKLIVIVSVVSSILGAAGTIGILYFWFGSMSTHQLRGLGLLIALVFPAAMVIAGSFFTYRHTARRRFLQALITATISIFLILSTVLGGLLVFGRSGKQISAKERLCSNAPEPA